MVDINKGNSFSDVVGGQGRGRLQVRDLMEDIDSRKKSFLQTQSESEQTNRINSSVSLSGHGVSVDDESLKDKYDMASRIDEAAALIVDYKQKNGEYITGQSMPIIKYYIKEKDSEDVYEAFYDYLHNPDADKYDFLVKSQLEEPNYEDKGTGIIKNILNIWNTLHGRSFVSGKDVIKEAYDMVGNGGLKNVASNLYTPIKIAAKGVNQYKDAFENISYSLGESTGYNDWATSKGLNVQNNTKEENAIREYVLDNYTDFGLRPSEEDWAKAEEDIINDPAILNRYKKNQNIVNASINTLGGGAWAIGAVSSAPVAIFHGLLSAGMELPTSKMIIQAGLLPITAVGELGDVILSNIPGVNKLWDSLDEDAQMFLKYGVAGKILGKAFMSENPKTGKMEIRESIRDFMEDPVGNVEELLTRWNKSRANKNAMREEYRQLKEGWKAEDEMIDTARQIGDTETDEQAKFVSNALSKLDEESADRITKYEELIDELSNLEKDYLNKKWDILKLDQRKIKEGDGIWKVTKKNEYGQTITENVDVPSRILDILERIYKGNPMKEMEIELMRRQYRDYGITRYHIDKLAAELSKAIQIYKEGSKDMVDTKFIENEVEPMRRAAKEFVRTPFKDISEGLYNPLEYLDRAISDIINSNSLFSDIKESVGEYKGNIPRRENWQKAGDWAARTYLSRGRNVINDVIGVKDYTPLTREQDLPKNLKYFFENKSKLEPDQTAKLIDEWIADTKKVEDTEAVNAGPIEGEVIEPKKRNIYDSNNYLEDILIDVEPRVVQSLIEDPKYNGLLQGIDYTKPIRVTPEGYAANYGETLESYKGKNKQSDLGTLLKLGYTEENLGKVLEDMGWEEKEIKEAKKAIAQESLFGEISKRVADIEDGVLKKAKKTPSRKSGKNSK